jgi:hypothetical protein
MFEIESMTAMFLRLKTATTSKKVAFELIREPCPGNKCLEKSSAFLSIIHWQKNIYAILQTVSFLKVGA